MEEREEYRRKEKEREHVIGIKKRETSWFDSNYKRVCGHIALSWRGFRNTRPVIVHRLIPCLLLLLSTSLQSHPFTPWCSFSISKISFFKTLKKSLRFLLFLLLFVQKVRLSYQILSFYNKISPIRVTSFINKLFDVTKFHRGRLLNRLKPFGGGNH